MRDIFKEKYFGGNTMKLGVKDKNVHFCTFRNQANFTRAGINGLKLNSGIEQLKPLKTPKN